MKAINRAITKGAVWMILFRIINRSIGFISTVILARLLVPDDFGLVALAGAFTAAIELLSAFNLDIVLIQNQQAERRHYDTAWSINVIMGGMLAIIMCAAASSVASFYDEPRLTNVIYVLAAGTFVRGLANVGVVNFRKNLLFHKDFYLRVSIKLIAFTATVVLAVILRTYWALVIGGVVSQAAGVVLGYYMQSYRPRFSLAAWREFFHFSKWLTINNGLFFANNKSANFIIGKLSGTHGLGLYSLASEISNLISTDFVAPINRAIFPGYAKMAEKNPAALRQAFINVISAIALSALPLGVGLAIAAEPLVHVVLGKKWLAIIPLIHILAISGIISAMQTNKNYVYLALGRPVIMTMLAGLQLGLLLPSLLVGASMRGVEGAALATLAVGACLLPLNYTVIMYVLKIKIKQLLAALWRPCIATVTMGIVMRAVHVITVGQVGLLGWAGMLVIVVAVGGVTYCCMILLLWRLSGRPDGMESFFLGKGVRGLKELFGRIGVGSRAA